MGLLPFDSARLESRLTTRPGDHLFHFSLAAFPLHGDPGGIADFLDWARTGSIGAVHSLGDDALGAKPASVGEKR
jgi:hypothetical protein